MSREITLPRPLAHQVEFLSSPARHKVVVCGRRWGKTTACLVAVLDGHGPGGKFRGAARGAQGMWVAPTFGVAEDIWRSLKAASHGAWLEKSEQARRITFPGGGSVTVRSADNPDSLRGVGLDFLVIDEAAFVVEEAWTQVLRPTLADKQGWTIFISTPNGQNWFYDVFARCPEQPNWARWQRPTSDNPKVLAVELAAIREEVGRHVFAQEHDAEFVAPGGALLQREWLRFYQKVASPIEQLVLEKESWPFNTLSLFGVVDLATSTKQSADRTCGLACALTRTGKLVVLDAVWDRLEGPAIVPLLRELVRKWRLPAIWIESVGFQLSLVQEARLAGLPVREIHVDKDKRSRFFPVTAWAESGKLWLPRDAKWSTEAVAEITSFTGTVKDRHDDFPDALSHAVATAAEMRGGDFWNHAAHEAAVSPNHVQAASLGGGYPG